MKKIKLSRKSQQKKRLVKNLLSSLILFEEVKTTSAKAKALKQDGQRLISKIKTEKNEVNLKRYIHSQLYGGAREKAYDNKDLFEGIAIYKLSKRLGDGANIVIVKLSKSSPATIKDKKSSEKDKK